ncbi:hypothetical protein MAPG_11208 [Magnaporthiopsis poae ATCC 64411]|uniref:Heterokaryon incompatibility domain-containing protein n=1 Tax=Magnaporthiopsis poae (strain ATCC 64411 / 73-15) TaxID=644358 RepID=A0A0C4EEN4_MAGP6|nr:hypothetical protein MAPG_11208 [Magnaporthiopsis poae ATCC 64411]
MDGSASSRPGCSTTAGTAIDAFRCTACRRVTSEFALAPVPWNDDDPRHRYVYASYTDWEYESQPVYRMVKHLTFPKLESSARRGCDLCRLLRQEILRFTKKDCSPDPRWSLRFKVSNEEDDESGPGLLQLLWREEGGEEDEDNWDEISWDGRSSDGDASGEISGGGRSSGEDNSDEISWDGHSSDGYSSRDRYSTSDRERWRMRVFRCEETVIGCVEDEEEENQGPAVDAPGRLKPSPPIKRLAPEERDQELGLLASRLIRPWIEQCESENCPPGFGPGEENQANSDSVLPYLPTRVIDVGPDGTWPRLHISGDGERGRYLALSYCWGPGNDSAMTTAANMQARTTEMAPDKLPKTIQDAIQLTRALGETFLWVDAVCIVQPAGGSTADWEKEAPKMCQYYRNAVCTIAATSAGSASEGFLHERHAERHASPEKCQLTPWVVQNKYGYRTGTRVAFIAPSHPAWDDEISQSPLAQRAWAMQERALSRRMVHWSKSALCVESDRLMALQGLADLVLASCADSYLFGLWRSQLLLGLTWKVKAMDWPRVKPATPFCPAPSWSWASCGEAVTYYSAEMKGWEDLAEVKNLDVVHREDGQLLEAKLRVRGTTERRTFGDRWGQIPKTRDGKVKMRLTKLNGDSDWRNPHEFITFDGQFPADFPESLLCLHLGISPPPKPQTINVQSVEAIVLQEVEGREGVFRRVGSASLITSHGPGWSRGRIAPTEVVEVEII